MVQNQHNRKLCPNCQRNVFATRPPPNIIFLVLFFPIYIIYYGLLPKNKCPICYKSVLPIDYNYPPFHGTPDSYDPSLLPSGSVIREESTFSKPEGNFLAYKPNQNISNEDPKNQNLPNLEKKQQFCMYCGVEIKIGAKFCHKCGSRL